MGNHSFNFEGGDDLSSMGASWFVSYAYHTYIDTSHDNWQRIDTVNLRINYFNRTNNHHKFWLEQVLDMENNRLSTNEIGLEPERVKEMAKELLESKKLEKEA